MHRGEIAGQVEVAEAVPDRLLHASRHAKRREIRGAIRVREITGDAELEAALAEGVGITLTEARGGEFVAHGLNRGPLLTPGELGLELRAIRPRRRRRIDEHESRRRGCGATAR